MFSSRCISLGVVLSGFLLLSGCASRQAAQTDSSAIEALMMTSESRFESCYSEFENRFPGVGGGELHLRADYLPNGQFANVRSVKSFTGSGPLIHCLTSVIESWRAAPPYSRGPVDLRFEYQRTPQTGGRALETEEIRKVLEASSGDFHECYRFARDRDTEISPGEMRLEFEVLASGQVGRLRELSGFRGSELIFECLEQRARQWSFPERERATSVVWRWSFARE